MQKKIWGGARAPQTLISMERFHGKRDTLPFPILLTHVPSPCAPGASIIAYAALNLPPLQT